MSVSSYQSAVNRIQKSITDLKKKKSAEISKQSKLIKDISDINTTLKRTKSDSTIKNKLNQLSRKQKDLATAVKKIADYDTKINNKTKELNRNQNYIDQAKERETKQRDSKEKQRQKEQLTGLIKINNELQKKIKLEKATGLKDEEKTESLFVLKGDVKGYSKIMSDPDLAKEFQDRFQIIVQKNSLECFYYNLSGGDSILVIDKDFKKILKIAKRIIEDTNDLNGKPSIRIAVDYGEITYKHSDGLVSKISIGDPLRISARLEPFVEPDEIWCTENCFNENDCIEKEEITSRDGVEYKDGYCNIKKKGSNEEDIWMRLYRIK